MKERVGMAVSTPVDFSMRFTNKVSRLRSIIEGAFSVELGHETDMNYRASQRLFAAFDNGRRSVGPHDDSKSAELSIFVSSKGAFYTWLIRVLGEPQIDFRALNLPQPKLVWNRVPDTSEPGIKSFMAQIARILEEEHFETLTAGELSEIVNGTVTDLDGDPASVFQVLFSEVD
jgi:hypothetical protein